MPRLTGLQYEALVASYRSTLSSPDGEFIVDGPTVLVDAVSHEGDEIVLSISLTIATDPTPMAIDLTVSHLLRLHACLCLSTREEVIALPPLPSALMFPTSCTTTLDYAAANFLKLLLAHGRLKRHELVRLLFTQPSEVFLSQTEKFVENEPPSLEKKKTVALSKRDRVLSFESDSGSSEQYPGRYIFAALDRKDVSYRGLKKYRTIDCISEAYLNAHGFNIDLEPFEHSFLNGQVDSSSCHIVRRNLLSRALLQARKQQHILSICARFEFAIADAIRAQEGSSEASKRLSDVYTTMTVQQHVAGILPQSLVNAACACVPCTAHCQAIGQKSISHIRKMVHAQLTYAKETYGLVHLLLRIRRDLIALIEYLHDRLNTLLLKLQKAKVTDIEVSKLNALIESILSEELGTSAIAATPTPEDWETKVQMAVALLQPHRNPLKDPVQLPDIDHSHLSKRQRTLLGRYQHVYAAFLESIHYGVVFETVLTYEMGYCREIITQSLHRAIVNFSSLMLDTHHETMRNWEAAVGWFSSQSPYVCPAHEVIRVRDGVFSLQVDLTNLEDRCTTQTPAP
ncbi:hypothetical protein GMRT_10601 [Giardia muris]|uniref:Uncharacterized protein n=1 Tax=Giardia muris TaxID=5742 RepID=A0A4Z1SML4_GIAMU|nr:hypothetical protein GMRT_10601 [Giardia muris]|eukprot:TNJ26820.1 hypothetical protein GMRT_10601 [Giardia muris]